jgi:uncharacterized protein YcbX
MTTTDDVGEVRPVPARVASIWRHPVKSLQGEQLAVGYLDADGLRGDRVWGIRDLDSGRILTARREPALLFAAATLDDDGEPHVTLPEGTTARGVGSSTDAVLSDWLRRAVSLVPAGGAAAGTAEYFADATDDTSAAIEWTMPPGRFVDAMPLLVLTSASLRTAEALHAEGTWEVRRFRPNLLIDTDADGWVEDGWCGRTLRIGSAVISPRQPCVRCTMVTRRQPELDRDLAVYQTLARHHGGTFGAWTAVDTPGIVQVGDTVEVG